MRITIQEGFVGILKKKGKIVRELPPGRYRYRFFSQQIESIDVRTSQVALGAEEFATKDNLVVRCAPSATWHVGSPTKMVRSASDISTLMRAKIVNALRAEVSTRTLDELLADVAGVHAAVEKAVKNDFQEIGLELESLAPFNLLIPRSLRQAFEAELAAKKRALADLEEARGRTAVLRHLANAASQVEERPVLLHLLMGQKAKHIQYQFSSEKPSKKSK